MRLIDFKRLEGALSRAWPGVERSVRDNTESLYFACDRGICFIHGPLLGRLGRGLYSYLNLELEFGPDTRIEAENANSQNLVEACATLTAVEPFMAPSPPNLNGYQARRTFPVESDELDSESDVVTIIQNVLLGQGAPNNPFERSLDELRAALIARVGAEPVGLSETLATVDDQSPEVIIWRETKGGDAYSIGAVVPEAWVGEAGVHYWRAELSYENYYDPKFDWLCEELVERAKTRRFKLVFASDWNRSITDKHWRFRACVSGDNRLIFRSPIIVARRQCDGLGNRLSQALQENAPARFDMPSIRFVPPPSDEYFKKFLLNVAKFAVKQAIKKGLGL